MDMTPFGADELRLSIDKLYRAASGAGGGSFYPSDDNPLPHGPWDPVIRAALEKFRIVAAVHRMGPHPDPWRLGPHPIPWAQGPLPDPWLRLGAAALNPQPLPPRSVWLGLMADEVIARAETMAEMAAAFADGSEERGIIIVGGYVSRFTGWCGNEPIVIHIPKGGRPAPDPDPEPWWRAERLTGQDLLVIGGRFAGAARNAVSAAASQAFAEAAGQLGMEAVARL
jgi:hypothetical protein